MTAPVAPGDLLLGKYRVERILGQGGMGIVVAARHLELGELFAIKFLLPQAVHQPHAIDRFVREARASARLKGEHVAKVHDVGRLPDDLPYMVLEHLTGQDLKETLRERGPLPVAEAVTYVLQACEAIAEAHGCGIVHRDLKPANLFLTRRANGTPCLKVLDFGISKQLEPENEEQNGLTKTGMLLGTPYYMSPEQMLQTKEADARSDIWSLGCVLYELLAGKVPFRANVLTELVGKVLQEEPEPLRGYRTDIPPAVEAAIVGCLVKRKEQRFQTIEIFAEALRAATLQPAFAAASAARPSALSHPGHDAASPPSTSAARAANTGPAPAANTAPGWGTTSPEASRPAPAKSRAALAMGGLVTLGALVGGGAWFGLRRAPPATSADAGMSVSSPATPSAVVADAPTIAASTPAPSGPPPTAERAMAPPPPEPTSKPVALHKVNPAPNAAVAHTPPPPSAKPAAEPPAAPAASGKKRGMY